MRRPILVLLCLLAVGASGCRSRIRPAWGETATLVPPRARAHRALLRAVQDPQTWAPALGALVCGMTDWDDDVADWARRERPVFGSRSTAIDAGTACVAATGLLAGGTGLAAPSGMYGREIARNKARAVAVELGAAGATTGLTYLLKGATQRPRPNGRDDESFPSLHTSLAASLSALNRRNASWLRTRPGTRRALGAVSTSLVAVTAWSRVEAGEHHPSDVLAGWALGNFTTILIHDAFLGTPADWRLGLGWRRRDRTVTLTVGVDL